MDSILQYSFEKFCKLVLRKYCRLRTNQVEIPPGPFIVCSNHASHLDTPALMIALQKPFHDFKMIAAKDHFQPDPTKRTLSQRLFNLILVDRDAAPLETRRLLKECELAKAQKKNIIIYPEGTRSTDAKMHSFKSGSIYLAQKLNLPIIPAAITGTGEALAKNRWFIRPTQITVRFGNPILPGRFSGAIQKATLQQLTHELEQAIQVLLAEVNDGTVC